MTMRSAARWVARWPGSVLLLGWALIALYGWPGIMTYDSFDQLGEARSGVYTDGHPPAMAALWRVLDHVVAGPLGLFVLQTGLLVGGLYAILARTFAPRRAALAAVAIAVFPPVLAPMVVVWKDALMAGFLLAGVAGLLAPRRGHQLAGLAALAAASAVRYNAPVATLPLVVLLFDLRLPLTGRWRPRLARYAVATVAWIAITAGTLLLNVGLTDRPMHFWTSSTALHDIAGTIAHVDDELPDAELGPILAPSGILIDHAYQATLRARYVPWDFLPLLAVEPPLWRVPIIGDVPAPEPQRDGVARAWWTLVRAHPGAFLAHRLAVTAEVLGLSAKQRGLMVMVHRGQNKLRGAALGVSTDYLWIQNKLQGKVVWLAMHTPLFRAIVYFAIALILLPLCLRHRDLLALLLSGLGLECSVFGLTATPDFRYSHWLVVCTVITVVVLVKRRAYPP